MPKLYKYFDLIATHADTTRAPDVITGSFVKRECADELKDVRPQYKAEGYTFFKIIERRTSEAPCKSIYTKAQLQNIERNAIEAEPVPRITYRKTEVKSYGSKSEQITADEYMNVCRLVGAVTSQRVVKSALNEGVNITLTVDITDTTEIIT